MKLKPIIEAKAKANQKAAGGAVPQKSAEAVETREELAKAAGVSHDTMHKVQVIEAEADESTKQQLRAGTTTINKAYQQVRPPKAAPPTESEP